MKYVLGAAVIILGIFLVVLSFIPIGIEPLTEVYFEDHTKLPKHVFPGQNYNFSFTVRNLEYQKMKYTYEVFVGEDRINTGEIVLLDNSSRTSFQEFKMPKGFVQEKVKINVVKDYSLEDPEFRSKLWSEDPNAAKEIDIHFWTNEIIGVSVIRTP